MSVVDWIYKLCRWSIGGIFIYAGTIKLLEPGTFVVLIEAYGFVPESVQVFLAVILPVLELAAGIGLLFDIQGSLAVIGGLLVLFVAILGYGIRMGLDVDCGCFGPGDPEAEAFQGLRLSFYRDLIMLSGIVFVYGWRRYRAIKPLKITRLIDKFWEKRRRKDAYV